jgi:hypothetical protein
MRFGGRRLGMLAASDLRERVMSKVLLDAAGENDGLRWPRRDGLKWPHFASVVLSG